MIPGVGGRGLLDCLPSAVLRNGKLLSGFPGIGSLLDVYPETGWTVVVVTNDGRMPVVSQEVGGREPNPVTAGTTGRSHAVALDRSGPGWLLR